MIIKRMEWVCCANVMTFLHAILMYAPLRTDFDLISRINPHLNFYPIYCHIIPLIITILPGLPPPPLFQLYYRQRIYSFSLPELFWPPLPSIAEFGFPVEFDRFVESSNEPNQCPGDGEWMLDLWNPYPPFIRHLYINWLWPVDSVAAHINSTVVNSNYKIRVPLFSD